MYLSLKDKIVRWCDNDHKMTAHWTEKEHWLNAEQLGTRIGFLPKNEIWDGNRFSEFSWFWDPSSRWTLPAKCPFCQSVMAQVAGQPSGKVLIRALLLLWTGNYPAQSEIGKFICHGIHPCRRCELEGT